MPRTPVPTGDARFEFHRTIPISRDERKTCGRCGGVGHIVTGCPKSETYARAIDRLGCEIEGYWLNHSQATIRLRDVTGHQGVNDGSLAGGAYCPKATAGVAHAPSECQICGAQGWEGRTSPASLGGMLGQLTRVYPEVMSYHAGFHVHVSFLDPMDGTLLCSKAFHEYFRARLMAWADSRKLPDDHLFRIRLRGDTIPGTSQNYCQLESWDDDTQPKVTAARVTSVGGSGANRYQMINFLSMERHGTVEFRVAPGWDDPHDAVSYCEELHALIEDWIHDARHDSIAEVGTTEIPASPFEGIAIVDVAPAVPAPERFEAIAEITAPDFMIPIATDPRARVVSRVRARAILEREYYARLDDLETLGL